MVNKAAPSLKLVAYERVSTARQGKSGLGLEAQRKAIDDFADLKGAQVLARFTEVESGRKTDRPELAKALNLAKLTGATLIIAKLDRLSRNAAFLLTLRDGVALRAAIAQNADDFARDIALVVEAIRAEGHTTLRAIAAELNARGMLTRRSGQWQVSNVRNLIRRIAARTSVS